RTVTFLGVARSGELLLRTVSSANDMYTAPMDPTTGRVTSAAVAVPTTSEGGGPAAWSSDSRRIAYLANVSNGRELRVFSVEDGKDQRVPSNTAFVNSLCWPSGGESILTNTITAPGVVSTAGIKATRFDVVRVDLASGEARPIFSKEPTFRLWNCTD